MQPRRSRTRDHAELVQTDPHAQQLLMAVRRRAKKINVASFIRTQKYRACGRFWAGFGEGPALPIVDSEITHLPLTPLRLLGVRPFHQKAAFLNQNDSDDLIAHVGRLRQAARAQRSTGWRL